MPLKINKFDEASIPILNKWVEDMEAKFYALQKQLQQVITLQKKSSNEP